MMPQELDAQLDQPNHNEKGYALRRLALDLTHEWLGIENPPSVQDSDACIVWTRIPVWTLEVYRRLGWSDGQLLGSFPTLRPADLVYA